LEAVFQVREIGFHSATDVLNSQGKWLPFWEKLFLVELLLPEWLLAKLQFLDIKVY
jgi:hypothetical protein